ncbi:antiterminator Q family protein [Acinetobacter sp. ANC 7454]|uniref:antiterminator Q family protein n=1 Tax=Acinetobacter thermotolerans TaxID=3151487 RepID=UPI00325B44CB
MNTTTARPHFSVAIDWKARTIEQWLEQYGSWLLIDNRYESLDAKGVMGHLLDLAQGQTADHRRRALPRCNITDNEALAVEALLCHVYSTETTKVKKWVQVAVNYHVDGMSEETIAHRYDISRFAVTRDKMLGIVRIVSKHSYLRSFYTD